MYLVATSGTMSVCVEGRTKRGHWPTLHFGAVGGEGMLAELVDLELAVSTYDVDGLLITMLRGLCLGVGC